MSSPILMLDRPTVDPAEMIKSHQPELSAHPVFFHESSKDYATVTTLLHF